MTDLENAKVGLDGHTLCLCKDGVRHCSDGRGISPIMAFIADGTDLNGFSAADVVVGKAAALLFTKCGIASVYAKTLSQSGKKILEKYGIQFEYGTLTERIINRDGTDTCPMEKTVLPTDDPETAYILLKDKLASMAGK